MSRFILGVLLLVTLRLGATECACQYHKARAEAGGTCSVTEDANLCTLSFSTSTSTSKVPSDVWMKLNSDDPNSWSERTFGYLPEIFSLSQTVSQREQTKELLKRLNSTQEIRLRSAFQAPETAPTSVTIDNQTFSASYGCFVVDFGTSQTAIKTPWAKARCGSKEK